jgi:hypothetical protein
MSERSTSRAMWLVIAAVVGSLLVLGFAFVHRWIEAGGQAVTESGGDKGHGKQEEKIRIVHAPAAVLGAMAADLEKADSDQRPQRRYLTLTHLRNNPQVSDESLDTMRQTLRQMAFFFAPHGESGVLRPLDADRTIFALDLQEIGWDPDATWAAVLKAYPYGLRHDKTADARLREADEKVHKLAGTRLAHVRGDWLMAAMTKSPLGGIRGELRLGQWPLPGSVRELGEKYDQQEVNLTAAAAELGLSDPARLEHLIAGQPRFRTTFGLGPLAGGGVVRRETWESRKDGASPFQAASRELDLGEPVVVR